MSAKSMLKFGLLAALEGTYGAGAVLAAATNGLLVLQEPDVALDYAFKGDRGGVSPLNGGPLAMLAMAGRKGTFSALHELKGGIAAYSATVKPTASLLLRAHGMSETVDTSVAGSEFVRYDYISGGFSSLAMQAFTRQESVVLRGAVVPKITIEAKDYGTPKLTADIQALAALPTDAAVPAITYPNPGILAPKATNVGLAVTSGGQTFVAKVASFTFTSERAVTDRTDLNDANGDLAGLDLGARKVSLEMLIEAAALTTTPFVGAAALDPYSLQNAGQACSLALAIGATKYNRWSLNGTNAYLASVSREKNGSVAQWKLGWSFVPPDEASEADAYVKFN